jgi:hypothetical protein
VSERSQAWIVAVRFLGLRVRIPPLAWISVSCERSVLSGKGPCVGLITRPEESYRVWCVWVCSWSPVNEDALAPLGAVAMKIILKKGVTCFRHDHSYYCQWSNQHRSSAAVVNMRIISTYWGSLLIAVYTGDICYVYIHNRVHFVSKRK